MSTKKPIEIGESSLPLGHSLVLHDESNQSKKPKKLETYSIPRSSLFDSLNAFLPQFKESCEQVQREVETTGTTHLAIEELVSDSDDSYSESSSESEMSVEEDSPVPTVEMRLAVAPMETVEIIEQMEKMAEPSSPSPKPESLVKEM